VKSHFEINKKAGAKCLIVFYDRRLDNFNRAIEKGLSDQGLKHGEATVIALPRRCESTTQKPLNF